MKGRGRREGRGERERGERERGVCVDRA